jgi:energy-coupling factor transporter ATP-binding protein EcfA2/energy-coupling factor transporter transmembrane protein EcfT
VHEVTRLLQADQVAYRYVREGCGLTRPTTLSVMPGELVLLTGPSGCGKSTLARCFTGLIPHLYHGSLSGKVWLGGLRTSETTLWRLAEWAGLVFQNPAEQMLAESVQEEVIFGLENLGCTPDEIRERATTALGRFQLEHLRARTPLTLSGGEQQKVALAAITARQPPVLVLDEPLSMLDSTAAFDLVRYLAELASAGTAVIVCEHRAEYLSGIPNLRILRLAGPEQTTAALPDQPVPLAPIDPFSLEVSGLRVALDGSLILKGLDLTARGGQVLAIVGRNGVGKTTLLRALVGLQEHEGTVTVNGRPADLGMVFQNADFQLFNPTVRDEILFALKRPSAELYAWLLGALGLTAYESAPPLLLSEGEKKRVALATVLMRQPRHGVLLDEPVIGQDAGHKAILLRLARQLAAAGQLVIITTHDLALAAEADRLIVLGRDGFVADGPPVKVLDDQACWMRVGLRIPPWICPKHAVDVAGSRPSEARGTPVVRDTSSAVIGPEVGVASPKEWAVPTGREQGQGHVPSPATAARSSATDGDEAAIRLSLFGKARALTLRSDSPLRHADPRTKLALSLCASLAVMAPLERLAAFMLAYVILLFWGRLLPMALRQVWRLKWVLGLLFALDWLLVGLDLAVIITLRLILLAGVFTLLVATTTPSEMRLALEWFRVPNSYAFSIGLAFQSLGLLDDEWRSIRDAQRSRGAWMGLATPSPQGWKDLGFRRCFSGAGWRKLREQVHDLVALTVPAVVLTVKRSWAITEAAYARGFDSPRRQPYRRLRLKGLDWILVALAVVVAVFLLWRG